MANSLQEQLVKAGLATQDQARKTRTTRRKDRKQGKAQDDGAKRAAEARRQQQAERDRKLNEKRETERKNQEIRQRIRDMVLEASLNSDKADTPYNVLHGAKVRRIYVTAEQRDGLAGGKLAVATARGRHHVIPLDVADNIAAMMPDYYLYRADKPQTADPAPAEGDDPYAEYAIPDDLMW
jgi:uncharacterized protein YaiL (DUF2058 family)